MRVDSDDSHRWMMAMRIPSSSEDLRVGMYGFSGITVRVANRDGRGRAMFLTIVQCF